MKKKYDYKWVGTMRTDPEFMSELARSLHKTVPETELFLEVFIEVVRKIAIRNMSLPIRRLGTFAIRTRKNSVIKNSATGLQETLPLIRYVAFKACKSWRSEVNARIRDHMLGKLRKEKTEDTIKVRLDDME